jgi:predicted DCC family thiol-disulfide oxidoreductase YuxK
LFHDAIPLDAQRMGMRATVPRPTVLYDAECAFCRWSLAHLLQRDLHERLRIVPLQSADAAALLPLLTAAERAAAAHLVTVEGRVYSGGAAALPLARLLGASAPVVALLRVLRPIMPWGYRLIAAQRTLLSRAVPSGARRRADRAVAQRLARS